MTVAGFSHSDHDRLAFVAKTRANQVEVVIAPVDLGAENRLEPLPIQGVERLAARLTLEPFSSTPSEQRTRSVAVTNGHGPEERLHRVLRAAWVRLSRSTPAADEGRERERAPGAL